MLHNETGWLLFFYTVPAKPGNLRMKVWRRLLKLGAVSLKGSVYLLPDTDDHLEALHWLAQEVAGLQGEAAFARVGGIETMSPAELVAQFNAQRKKDYLPLQTALEALEIQFGSLTAPAEPPTLARGRATLGRLVKEFRAIQALDFFHSPQGAALQQRLEGLTEQLGRLAGPAVKAKAAGPCKKEDYQGRVWVTRQNPFVDRMASAWLIRRFIDPQARFEFLEQDQGAAPGAVSFDLPGGDFSHEQDRCTFEVLLAAFALPGQALRKIAEIVHELDLKDGIFSSPLAAGVEGILQGLRQTARDDREALEEGIQVFARLFAALSK